MAAIVRALLAIAVVCFALESVAADVNDSRSYSSLKAKLCALDFQGSRTALDLIEVIPETPPSPGNTVYPRVLCFVNTISVHHKTRAQAVAETWGQRCEKLLFFSNVSDTVTIAAGTEKERSFEVIPLDVPADHDHLWQKHKATLQYVHEHFRHDYDWIYKADDDAYVIMENLRNYLLRPEIMQAYTREPMQMGHRFNMPDSTLNIFIKNDTLNTLWHSRWDNMVYNSGGPGYIMNRLYLDKFVQSIPEWTCLSDAESSTVPDDMAISYCMMWYDVYPWDTRDYRGRERWHAYSPSLIYRTWDDPNDWYVRYHTTVGGVRAGDESAAPDSVAFHYVKPDMMYHIERSLYLCRTGDEIPDVEAFNKQYGLALGGKVMLG
ncbi:Glycoprotein-N-acetylgalactosamine 3-beta-galactosyltransferase 1 [Phytophthora citrophthora]|uniref:N-acetylgalactosaminide beta-1,3-galactosyltransferase n=1 Tax=Phytophthora citrophthora TaxID=4793 RepID=A0AAD9GGV1_9STRA|nr:Glycoprotein-N-acetylgalactosamine 3-beta-galactosyltransferase 1 [Phytophthora citrophthora]